MELNTPDVASKNVYPVKKPSFSFRLTSAQRFWATVAIFVLLSVVALTQQPREDPINSPSWFSSMEWWRQPLEWNAASRLPRIECNLNSINVSSDGSSIWSVGNKGMIVSSLDGGKTWTMKPLDQSRISGNAPAPNVIPSPGVRAASLWNLLDFVPTASAAVTGTEQRGPTSPPNRTIPLPSGDEPLIATQFADSLRGEAVSGIGWRYLTSDGGATWTREFIKLDFFVSYFSYGVGTPAALPPLLHLQIPKPGDQVEYIAVTRDNYVYRANASGTRPVSISIPPPSDLRESPRPHASQFLKDVAYVVARNGTVLKSTDNGANWSPVSLQTSPDLHGLYFRDASNGWVVGKSGTISVTSDGGSNWSHQHTDTLSQLNSVIFNDGQNGWIAGNDGLILSTSDGGETWLHRTQGREGNGGKYLRFPAPWYFLSLLVIGVALSRRRVDPVTTPPEESVADILVSDRPLENPTADVLSFVSIARGLSRFLRNENTIPPLTIAITGEWGTGKSSLMNLLRMDLRSYKFRPVWFNAWHHQKEEHILASLLENIKLQAVPRWWTLRGITFRFKLLGIRGLRHWGPIALLLFVIYVLLVYRFGGTGSEASFNSLIQNITSVISKPLDVATTTNLITLLPLLASIITFLTAVWKGITAFGVKPASLLAGVSNGMSIRGLEAQTSFRQKFAVQFRDVTKALGDRCMLIFIDDLDRCRPDQVVETLEAVNFLTTSGECFVVIGMAREYVERCVGRAFKDIAEEMIDRKPEEGQPADDLPKRKRIEFARQYLDKLINIEVPVPAPREDQAFALLIASTKEEEKPKPRTRSQEIRLGLFNALAGSRRLVVGVLSTVLLLALGAYLARSIDGPSTTPTLVRSTDVPTTKTPPGSTTAPGTTTTGTTAPAQPSPAITNERAVLVAGGRPRFSPNILPILGLLALIWVGVALLSRKPGLVVKDSPRFVDALEIWHPLVFARQSTPRATKRFLNHVRYLAMRQRKQGEEKQSRVEYFLCWVKEKITGVKIAKAPVLDLDRNVKTIPDEILVALCAQESLGSDILGELLKPVLVTESELGAPKKVNNLVEALRPLFQKAWSEHQNKFSNVASLDNFRERFREMTRNVQVR